LAGALMEKPDDGGLASGQFQEQLEKFGVASEKAEKISEHLGSETDDLSNVTAETAKQMEDLVTQLTKLEDEFKDYEQLLEKAKRQKLSRDDILSKKEDEHAGVLEAGIKSKKADIIRTAAGKGPVKSAAETSMGGGFTKVLGRALGGPLKMALGFVMGDMLGRLTSTLKETVTGINQRSRQGLTLAGRVTGRETLAGSKEAATVFFRDLQTELEKNPLLKLYGGEQAVQNFTDLMRVGKAGGLGKETLLDDTQKKEFVESMELMAVKALMSGMNLDEFAKAVQDNIHIMGLNQKRSEGFVEMLAEQEKKLKLPTGSLINHIKSANSSLRQWGHTLGESTYIARRWGKAIEQGRIAMGDIIDFVSSLHKVEEGQTVFMLDVIKQMKGLGGDIAKAIEAKAGGDPLAMINIFKRVAEQETGIGKKLGLDEPDWQLKDELRKSMFDATKSMAEAMGGKDNAYLQNALLRRMSKVLLNIDAQGKSIKNFNEMFGAISGIGKWGLRSATGIGRTKAEKEAAKKQVKDIKKTMERDIGPIDKATITAQKAIIMAGDWVSDLVTGKGEKVDVERAETVRQMVGQGRWVEAKKLREQISTSTVQEKLLRQLMGVRGGGGREAKIASAQAYMQQLPQQTLQGMRNIIVPLVGQMGMDKTAARDLWTQIENGNISQDNIKKIINFADKHEAVRKEGSQIRSKGFVSGMQAGGGKF